MKNILAEKPSGYFDHLMSENIIWFNCYDKNGTYCFIAIEIAGQIASTHIHIFRWSHGIKKSLAQDWEEIKNICKSNGVQQIIASNQDIDDDRWPKFIKMFGFGVPQLVYMSKQEI